MILTFGNMQPHQDLNWYMLELRSEKTVESTLRRLGQSLPALFRESAVEIFIPISRRDLNVFELNTGTYIYARSPHFAKLLRLKTITGIVGLATLGETGNAAHAMKVDHSFVQQQISDAEFAFLNRANTIEEGSFVRIVDGDMRDWCGTVTNIHDGVAVVRVALKTKIVLIETPVRNLLDKSFVPAELRVFYYGSMVESLVGQGLTDLIADDIEYQEDDLYTEDGLEAQQPKKHSRQQTVTALVKRLIVQGTIDPSTIAKDVLQTLCTDKLKKPRNLSIVHGVIKSHLLDDHFRKIDPTLKNYREAVEKFGPAYKFSIQDLKALDPGCGIPLTSDGEEVKEDE